MTAADGPQDLISAAELAALRPAPVLLDVRWTLAGGSDPDGYRAGHLPGARFVDLPGDLSAPPGAGGRHPLPDPERLQRTWRRLGIDDGATVVVYDGGDGSGAVRAWWLLRWSGLVARVLDGGLAAWPGELATGDEVAPEPGTVTVRPGHLGTVELDAAANLAQEPWSTLLDARAGARFRGEVEPLDPKAGHIPGSVNLPYPDLYGADGRLKPAVELRALFAAAGVVPGRPAAASCGSGVTAGHLVLAGRVAGLDLALFPGSWSQWCLSGRPVATGEA